VSGGKLHAVIVMDGAVALSVAQAETEE